MIPKTPLRLTSIGRLNLASLHFHRDCLVLRNSWLSRHSSSGSPDSTSNNAPTTYPQLIPNIIRVANSPKPPGVPGIDNFPRNPPIPGHQISGNERVLYLLHVYSSRNNTICSFTDGRGNPIAVYSGRSLGFKRSPR